MARTLPKKRNPLVAVGKAPSHEELLSARDLGSTKLTVELERENTSNSTKPENLGLVEYAYLQAPLPHDLTGSEIFAPPSRSGQAHPKNYFLMRRSKDGFVSATGMFKIAFPWAQYAEETREREHLKSLNATSEDEMAGNVWITPEAALDLAEEYGIRHWLDALLDPSDIVPSPKLHKKNIAPPPKFEFSAAKLSPPASEKKSRSIRSSSPTKSTSQRAKASPRKRQTKKEREANDISAQSASSALQDAVEGSISLTVGTPAPDAEAVAGDPVNTSSTAVEEQDNSKDEDEKTIKIAVSEVVEVNGDRQTNVEVVVPADMPEMNVRDTEDMIAEARRLVQAAREEDAATGGLMRPDLKRAASEIDTDIDAELPIQPAKRARVLEERMKREKVRTRALGTVAASLAVAVAIPFLQSFFA